MRLQSESSQTHYDVACELTRTDEKGIQLLSGGLQRKEISFQLNISANTLKTHLRSAYRKLGVHNQAGIAAMILVDSEVTDNRELS